MNSSTTYRYPGPEPFQTSQQHLFFGREKDTQDLYELISLEQMVVVYAKSGLGKSSLLNAGIIPKMQAEGDYTPQYIRLHAYAPDQTHAVHMPVATTIAHLSAPQPVATSHFLDQLIVLIIDSKNCLMTLENSPI